MKVLLIEDNRIAQKVAKFILEECHAVVDVVSSGKEAILNAQQERYDIIFIDIGLGDIDGGTVAKEIKSTVNPNSLVPIVALTAHGDEAIKTYCAAVGIEEFILKPLRMPQCQAILDKYSGSASLKND